MLTPNIAQSIVNRTMNLINYNINIMDENGIIIASGDSSRLNTYHQGADSVLREKKAIEITKGNSELLLGSKEGVNFHICLNGKIVGVVGITGDPEEVRIYGAMVQAMAELMLEEAFYWEQVSLKEQARFSLINDLIHRDPGKDLIALRTRADILGYDLDIPRVAMVFKVSKDAILPENVAASWEQKKVLEFLSLTSQDLFASGIGDKYVLLKKIVKEKDKGINEIERAMESFKEFNLKLTVGIGKVCFSINQIPDSFEQALQALEVGSRLLGTGKIYDTKKLGLEKFVDKVGKEFRQNFSQEVLEGLRTKDEKKFNQLLITAKVFLESNLKAGETIKKLFIHRNTLFYRLNMIKEKTGLDLNNSLADAIKFKLALFCRQYDEED